MFYKDLTLFGFQFLQTDPILVLRGGIKMDRLWTYIDGKKWTVRSKYQFALLVMGMLSALTGSALWLIVRIWAFSTWDWLICFAGYPAVISVFVVFFYSNKHGFHHGAYRW